MASCSAILFSLNIAGSGWALRYVYVPTKKTLAMDLRSPEAQMEWKHDAKAHSKSV